MSYTPGHEALQIATKHMSYTPGHEALQIATKHMGDRFVKSKGHNIPSHEFLRTVSRPNSKGKMVLGSGGLHRVMHGKIIKHQTVKETAEHRRKEDLNMLQRFFTKTGALQSRDIQKLKDILGRQLVKPDEVMKYGYFTLLQKFASSNDPLSVQAMKILLQYGADPSRALSQAVGKLFKSPEKLELLMASGASLKSFDSYDIERLIQYNKVSVIKLLLSHKVFDINKELRPSPGRSHTFLMEAVRSGSLPIVKLLVEHGARLNTQGTLYRHNNVTALDLAFIEKHKDIVQYLLDRGASFGSKGKDPYYVANVYEFAGRRKPLWTYIPRPR